MPATMARWKARARLGSGGFAAAFAASALVCCAHLTSPQGGSTAMDRALRIGFEGKASWRVSADEPWWSLVDLRNILNIFHRLSVSRSGAAAGATRIVTIPSGWQPPLALRFYCADDYVADPAKHKPGQVGTESFFEHRYKQVLIDGRAVWERDVFDENADGSQTVFTVDISSHVRPGRAFALTFRAFDRTTTLERNDRDVWFIGGTWYSTQVPATQQEPRFHTAAWFADPVVGEEASVSAAPSGDGPHVAAVAARHAERWPLPPRGRGTSPIEIVLASPAAIRLVGPAGELPVQCRATATWPDGNIRWLLLETILPAGTEDGARFRLLVNEGPAKEPARAIVVRGGESTFDMDTGALLVRGSTDAEVLLESITLTGTSAAALGDLRLRMAVLKGGSTVSVSTHRTKVAVIEPGPLRACLEVHGLLDAGEEHIGRFVFRLYGYAGLPTLQAQIRVFNDVKPEPYRGTIDDPPLEVVDLALTGACGEPLEAGSEALLVQDSPAYFCLDSSTGTEKTGARAQGWIAVPGEAGGLQVSLWGFWQQYPKSLGLRAGKLEIGLFAPVPPTPSYRPRYGEAKRHDLWPTFGPGSQDPKAATAHGLLADEPPRLFDGRWFCESGSFAVLDPRWFARNPAIEAWVRRTYREVSSEDWPGQFGMRDFGDAPYNAELANADYLARELPGLGSTGVRDQARPMLTLLRAWQATGEARYRGAAERCFDLSFMKRELLDWRRGTYIMPMYENYRLVSAGLDSMYAHNVYEYYRQTGDLDAAQLVVAIADSIYAESMLPQEEALGSFIYYPRYSRQSDYFPQMAMLFLMAYDLTEDSRFLRAARAATGRYLLHGGETPSYQVVHNFGWIDPELGGWLREMEAVSTEPFTITSEVPTPDPANFT